MAISFRIIKPHDLVSITFSGRISFDDIRGTASDLSKDPGFSWGQDRLIFVKGDADFSKMTLEVFRDLKDTLDEGVPQGLILELIPSELPAYRVAVVCGVAINQIMMQMFGAIWETDPNPIVAVERFAAVSDALNWLGQETVPESEFREELIGV